MSRRALELLTLLAALAAFVSNGTGQAQSRSEREANLTLDCLDGDESACRELDRIGGSSEADLQSTTAPTSDSQRILFDIYKMSSVRPRELDSFIHANRSLFDNRFYSCLSKIQTRAPALAQVHDRQCMAHLDSVARSRCLQLNSWRGMDRHLSDLERTILSNGAISWLQTSTGQQEVAATQIIESQIQQFRQDTYPQLVFVLGQQLADQRLQTYTAQLYAGLEKTVEPLRDHLYCQ